MDVHVRSGDSQSPALALVVLSACLHDAATGTQSERDIE